ncbi:hypothetical protein EBS80_04975, partial [bacterium]|nr:hypothetical protein [bacterium]
AAFLDVACGNGFLLADEVFDGADCAQFDHADVRASFARGPGLTFHSTWTDVTRDAKKHGDFDVAFLWDVLRCAHTPFNEVVRVRAVARRLAIVEAVTNSRCRPRSTQSLAVIDWLRTRVLFPDRTFVHHGRYQALEDWRHLLRRANASIVTECAIPEGTLSVPGDHRLFVCDFP